jgi:hypothetical protein
VKNIRAAFFTWGGSTTSATLTIDDKGFGVIDANAKKVFTQGQCHALAIALNQLAGWPIKGVGYPYEEPESPSHCLNYSPKLKGYVDIEGLHKRVPQYGRNWRVLNRNISQDTAKKYLAGYMKPNVRAAIPFAKTILRDLEAA